MEHDAPVGAPVQVSDAVPLVPWPPMERKYVALEPADTLAKCAGAAGSYAKPDVRGAARSRECAAQFEGCSRALSEIVTVPEAGPFAVGVKVTVILQVPPFAKTDVPHVLVSAKVPVT